jgi:glycosyltransferase involved in cell wall biosynthesis
MRIKILLPYKETFSPQYAGAISLLVKNEYAFSCYSASTTVYGRLHDKPVFEGITFNGLKPRRRLGLGSKNIGLARAFFKELKQDKTDLVELHNRPYLFHYLFAQINTPITLHLHNDPLSMKGSCTAAERIAILDRAAAVICVSNHIKSRFMEGIAGEYKNCFVLNNGVHRTLSRPPEKSKSIVFVGQISKNKGPHLLLEALQGWFSNYPDWKCAFVGGSKHGDYHFQSDYERAFRQQCTGLGAQVQVTGYLPNAEVAQLMQQASVVVVPSIWQEPFGIVAAEALAHGAILLASNVGGLADIVAGRGVVLSECNAANIKLELQRIVTDAHHRQNLINRAWQTFDLTAKKQAMEHDRIRELCII